MQYEKIIVLKDGTPCLLRSAGAEDAREVLEVFIRCHGETDWLLTYPEETPFTEAEEAAYLNDKLKHDREAELCAVVEGRIVGTAGIESLGNREKTRHRCAFGISILRDCWGRGIGGALLEACLSCAKAAGYEQMELDVVADNERALALYRRFGFVEYGRNPRGFKARGGWQAQVLMRLDLTLGEVIS